MKQILELLAHHPAIKSLEKKQSNVVANEPTNEALLIASAFHHQPSTYIIVKSNLFQAQRLYDRLVQFCDPANCLLFPVDESLRIEALAASPEMVTQRVYVLHQLLQQKPLIIVTNTVGILRHLPVVDTFRDHAFTLRVGDIIAPNNLIQKLIENGYHRVHKIDHSLQVAMRGGVLDFFSVNFDHPIRLEFDGNQIESIRFFDYSTQRTIGTLPSVEIIPATDLLLTTAELETGIQSLKSRIEKADSESIRQSIEKDIDLLIAGESQAVLYKYYALFSGVTASLLDYAPKANIVVSPYQQVKDNYELLLKETYEYLEEEHQGERRLLGLDFFHSLDFTLDRFHCTLIYEFKRKSDDLELPIRSLNQLFGNSQMLKDYCEDFIKRGYKVLLVAENTHQVSWIQTWAKEHQLMCPFVSSFDHLKHPLQYTEGSLKEGFEMIDAHYVLMGAHEIFGRSTLPAARYSRYQEAIPLKSYDSLLTGDYVVHETHGVGQYLGIVTKEIDGIHRDYLHIAYRGEDRLFVPLEQFKLIRKFVSRDGVIPKLNKLGSEEWTHTKQKIKKRVADIADKLIQLYAQRTQVPGYAFSPDSDYQVLFENAFPYELTPDQLKAAQEIKADMEKPFPMDRLLCGDVGFGKTEVAFIAAFKAMNDGKQVAFLCPTTLLSRQHYERAQERFRDFPIKIALLNRFVPESEQQRILEQVKKGEIHLIIGTHRLLSADLQYRDLGLLIIDEEHRFGVEHKEKIKMIKTSIDVLTLTATPIPRTLQMALLGIRNLSQIDTPPNNRMPIQTYVIEKNEKLVREIIERELGRQGQVFYLYNHIDEINQVALKIRQQVRGASVIVIHGKMHRDAIEEAMIRFNNKEANVMVCTTIIENGIDIPNANTILIEDADHFGLSQLYQIKGRVGRSDRLAYAYLLYRPQQQLSEVATKRLRAIKDFTELGSGYRIAMRDLSIRGAGDILGAEQAGFIDTVGIDLYMRLLQEAIEERKTGKPAREETAPKSVMQVDAYIPPKFTDDDMDKINLYKQIDQAHSLETLANLNDEMADLYGKLPAPVQLLLEKRRLEILTSNQYIEDIFDSKDYLEIKFSPLFMAIDGIGLDLFEIATKISVDIAVTFRKQNIRVRIPKKGSSWMKQANELFQSLNQVLIKHPIPPTH